MERQQARSIDPRRVRHGYLSHPDSDKCVGIISVDAWSALPANSRPIPGYVGSQTARRDSLDQDLRGRSGPSWNQLQAVRRKLWILGARLECLPAKIELACRKNGLSTGDGEPEQRRHAGNVPLATNTHGVLGRWLARWKLARLQSRASRAERRSAAAISAASAWFAAALDAVLEAAVSRAMADAAHRAIRCDLPSQTRDERMSWESLEPRPTSERNSS